MLSESIFFPFFWGKFQVAYKTRVEVEDWEVGLQSEVEGARSYSQLLWVFTHQNEISQEHKKKKNNLKFVASSSYFI